MGWLVEMLVTAVREFCAQIVVDLVEVVNKVFLDLLSCDLDLFEELFSVVGTLYKSGIAPFGIALALLICLWQLFKSLFGRMGVEAEDPVQLVLRTCLCLFLIVFARGIVNYVLDFAGTPYEWIVGTKVKAASFAEYASLVERLAGTAGMDGVSVSLLSFVMLFVVAWNYFKMLFSIAERYVLLGVFSYTAPLAFATGGSKATDSILAGWAKAFGGQVVLIVMNAWCIKMFLSGFANIMATGYGFTKFFVANLCLIGFCKIAQKMDSYMSSLGINIGRQQGGMGAVGAAMMLGRVAGVGSNLFGSGSGSGGGAGSASVGGAQGGGAPSGEGGTIAMGAFTEGGGTAFGGIEGGYGTASEEGTEDVKNQTEGGNGETPENTEQTADGTRDDPFGVNETETVGTDAGEGIAPIKGELDGTVPLDEGVEGMTEGETMGDLDEDGQGIGRMEGDGQPVEAGMDGDAIETLEGSQTLDEAGRENQGSATMNPEGVQGTSEGSLETGAEGCGISEGVPEAGTMATEGVQTRDTGSGGSMTGSRLTKAGTGVPNDPTTEGVASSGGSVEVHPGGVHGGGLTSGNGYYCMERDGEKFVRYDADAYQRPDVDYEPVEEDGKTYYEVPTNQIGMKTTIKPNGKVVVERNFEDAVKKKNE